VSQVSNVVHLVVDRTMTPEQYRAERAKISDNDKRRLALLFHRSGWTSEQLAEHEGGFIGRHARRLQMFGRFLTWQTAEQPEPKVPQSVLSESRFRRCWMMTDKEADERTRFSETLKLIKSGAKPRDTRQEDTLAQAVLVAEAACARVLTLSAAPISSDGLTTLKRARRLLSNAIHIVDKKDIAP
jgi:hypothetical protein